MKIILTTGLVPKKGGLSSIRQGYFPPLGLGYIAAVLKKEGHDVKIYDCLPLKYSVYEVVDYILKQRPDIVGISIMSTCYDSAREMSDLIKKKVNIPIIFGGPHCSSFPIRTMEECPGVDFLIYGEGEFIFPMLVEAILGKLSYSDIPQLCFRDSRRQPILNKQEQLIQDLDRIPFPAWHLFNRRLYSISFCPLITSRGCSYGKCAFCMRTGFLYEKYRRRTVENAMRELEFLYRDFSYNKIIFLDDNFAQDEEWVTKFCNTLIQKKMDLQWICNARVDTITEKMIKKMAEAGCCMIMYGIESGSQDLLNYIRKGISIEQIREAIKITKKSGIKTFGYFMLALPKEIPERGKQTVQFAIDLDLDFAQFVPTRPLFGTRLYDLCKQEGRILDDSYEFYDTSVSSSILIPKIKFIPIAYKNKKAVRKIIKFAYRRFYLRYSYIWKLLRNKKYQIRIMKPVEWFLLFIRITFLKLD